MNTREIIIIMKMLHVYGKHGIYLFVDYLPFLISMTFSSVIVGLLQPYSLAQAASDNKLKYFNEKYMLIYVINLNPVGCNDYLTTM